MDIDWIRSFHWHPAETEVDLTRDQIRHSPKFDPHEAVNREYEDRLYDYYGKPRYWLEPEGPSF